MKIVITTSGIGSRLGDLTKYTNKSLVRIGNKYPICYIIDKYKKTDEFIITLGYYGDFVKQFLQLSYPDYNFIFVNVDKYDGPGSSLGYSLLQVKQIINEPFIFHCCDNIYMDNIDWDQIKDNTFFVYNNTSFNDSNLFSSVNIQGEMITKINNKGVIGYDYIYTGLAYIKDYILFFDILERLYREDQYKTSLSDIHVAREMLKQVSFKYFALKEWYDMGTVKNLNITSKILQCDYNILQKNEESLCFLNDKVIKFFYNKDINIKRAQRGNILFPLVPKIIGYSENYHVMEFLDGRPLSECFKYGEIYNLLNWAKAVLWKPHSNKSGFKEICLNFYNNKTKQRVSKLLRQNIIDKKIINGILVGSIEELLSRVDFNYLCNAEPYQYHGDFILDNILKTKDGYKLIDWRQDFGGDIERGDMYYDLSKLRHNIIFNHNNVENNLYTVKDVNADEAIVDIKCNYVLIQQLQNYEKFIKENGLDLYKIKILMSLIWINMAPLHEYPLSKFLFYFGKYNLFLTLNQ